MKYDKDSPLSPTAQDFVKWLYILSAKHDISDVWSDFVEACACSISNAVDAVHFKCREQTYLGIAAKYGREGMDIIAKMFTDIVVAFDRNPRQDFLGTIYHHLSLQQQGTGSGVYTVPCQ